MQSVACMPIEVHGRNHVIVILFWTRSCFLFNYESMVD